MSKFAEFIRNATDDEKERVYGEVLDKATKRQAAMSELKPSILERHARIGAMLTEAGFEASHPVMIDWAVIGFALRNTPTPSPEHRMVPVEPTGERVVQVSGFGVENTSSTQCNYMLVAVTNTGRVVMSMGDREWTDVSPKLAATPPVDGDSHE